MERSIARNPLARERTGVTLAFASAVAWSLGAETGPAGRSCLRR